MRLNLRATTYILQGVVQLVWGMVCYFILPHEFLLSFVNMMLLGLTIASKLVDDEGVLIRRLYFATWLVPLTYMVLAASSNLMNFYSAAGINRSDLPFDSTPHQYIVALGFYLISQFIPPFFVLIRWLVRNFDN